MYKGIKLGLLMRLLAAFGYLVTVNIALIKSEWFQAGLMIISASTGGNGEIIFSEY
ncbi:MAG: hypothetical protein PVF74_09925 [Anaerolineales bacterium]|jgi:hypothetical protein